jgi:small subunit ribosomal protein S11
MTTFTDEKGNVRASFSGGKLGFKHAGRSSYEAGYQCAVRLFQAIEEHRKKNPVTFNIALFLNGFGQGRDAMQKALMTVEGEKIRNSIVSITDRTPIKVGGTRAKKQRRG